MKITLKDLFDREIFESYDILCAQNHLMHPFDSVSIMETPDFSNYIIENSLMLTTFYPVKTEVDTILRLIHELKKKNTAGIVIKMHRYIDVIPNEVLDLSNQLEIPIIALHYDANLSLLFNNILSELQSKDYSSTQFDANYSNFLKQVYEEPTTKTLMQIVEKIPDLEVLIVNLDNKKTYTSNDVLSHYYEQFKHTKNLFHRMNEAIYYSEDVIYDERPIYHVVLMAKNDRRHILHNYIEIFKLMIIVIHQKKLENILKQNQFLLNFVSNLSSNYSNIQLIEMSKRYHWNISFPITLLLFSIKDSKKYLSDPNIIEYIRTVIINTFHLSSDEIRYTILNDYLLFIINTIETLDIHQTIHHIFDIICNKYKQTPFKIAYSNLIFDAAEISKTYFLLSEAMAHIENTNLSVNIFDENDIRLLNLLKHIDYRDLRDYVYDVLKKLLDYEEKNSTPLIETLYTLIECRFNVKTTADKLFIHYNTVRYRLEVIEQLGFQIFDQKTGYFNLYFALHLYKNFKP
jgi:PucR family transcriptional regulator, purine catabolism regulatory protein